MSGRLAGKVALVSGAGTGIGAAIARRFAAAGARVALMGRRVEPIRHVAAEIAGLAVPGDTTRAGDCTAAVGRTVEAYGGLDIVVANAGVISAGSATALDPAAWSETLDVNVSGVLTLCRAALPAMIASRRGAIVTVSSVAGLATMSGMAAYVTSKHALQGLTKALAIDYGRYGVRVNALAPGWVHTPMSAMEMREMAARQSISAADAEARTVAHLPLGRMAEPDEIAACAEFLASDDASFVTGATLVADGGGAIVDVGSIAL